MSPSVDRGEWGQLEAELTAQVAGTVSFDAGTRALHTADASNYPQVRNHRNAQLVPRSVDDVIAAVGPEAVRASNRSRPHHHEL